MQIIFTATLGRNGSQNLIQIFNRFGNECIGEHEPPDLPLRNLGYRPFFRKRGWLGPGSRAAMVARNFQRRFVAPDFMVGRGKALEWIDHGDTDKLEWLANRRLNRLRRYEKKYRHYLEASPYFLRTYGHQTYELRPDLGLIKLTRDPLRNAKSFVNRQKNIFRNSLPPDHPTNRLRLTDWQQLSKYQLYLHQWFETELRFREFIETHSVRKTFELTTPDLSNASRMQEMFDYFEIDHLPFSDLSPTNTASEHGKQSTKITAVDISEYEHFLELVPSALLTRINYLHDFIPAEG